MKRHGFKPLVVLIVIGLWVFLASREEPEAWMYLAPPVVGFVLWKWFGAQARCDYCGKASALRLDDGFSRWFRRYSMYKCIYCRRRQKRENRGFGFTR